VSSVKAAIFGLNGLTLSDEEKRFFVAQNPLGFILFARNCESPEQLRGLTRSLLNIVERTDVPILIDQEGGRVSRLKPPHWRKPPPAKIFADYATATSIREAAAAIYANTRLIARELHALGITVDCAPLADVPVVDAHDIIGDRAFGTEPQQVAELAGAMAQGLLDGGVLPVLKHIPGHGRARADSHEELPTVHESLEVLRKTDFVPFKALAHLPMGMTAHILYTAIDAEHPATLSPSVIRIVREEIGFNGLLMSDDLSMKALRGSFAERTQQSLAAGCDVVLHCNGDMSEMQSIAEALPALSPKADARFVQAWAQLKKPTSFAYETAEASLAQFESAHDRKTA
jgi:beta-N-acetylhexosaminidase